jgi:hypothetical protein
MTARLLPVLAVVAGLALGLSWPRGPTPPGPFPAPTAPTVTEAPVPAAVAASRRLAPEIPDARLAQVLPADLPAPPVVPTSILDALAHSACLVPFEAGPAYVALWREAAVATRLAACRCERRAVHALDGLRTLSQLYAEEVARSETVAWQHLHALWLRHGPEAGAACLRLFGADSAKAEEARRVWGSLR